MTKEQWLQVAGRSDIGRLRQANEDAILIDEGVQLYAVADGMGGHGSGDVASQLALETLQQCVNADSVSQALANTQISDEQALALVFQCIAGVNRRIYQENVNNGNPDGAGMGTTLVGLCLYGDNKRGISFNIGDSRLYRFQNDQLTQLTTDHTMYQAWVEEGRVGPAPPPNLIVRAVGLFPEVDIDLEVLAIDDNETYLLCSDGLSSMIDDEKISTVMAKYPEPETQSKNLVVTANEYGGADNISVITLVIDKNSYASE